MPNDKRAKSAPFRVDVRTGMGNLMLGAGFGFPSRQIGVISSKMRA